MLEYETQDHARGFGGTDLASVLDFASRARESVLGLTGALDPAVAFGERRGRSCMDAWSCGQAQRDCRTSAQAPSRPCRSRLSHPKSAGAHSTHQVLASQDVRRCPKMSAALESPSRFGQRLRDRGTVDAAAPALCDRRMHRRDRSGEGDGEPVGQLARRPGGQIPLRGRDPRVSHRGLHAREINAARDEQRAVGVAKVVEPQRLESGGIAGSLKTTS